MFSIIALIVLNVLSFGALLNCKKPFAQKGWLTLLFSYGALWVAFFSFRMKWWILLIFGIVALIGVCLWISIEIENEENKRNAAEMQGGVSGFFGGIAKKISGNSEFAQTVFGSIADGVSSYANQKLGNYNVQEAENSNAGRGLNTFFFLASLACVAITAIFFRD